MYTPVKKWLAFVAGILLLLSSEEKAVAQPNDLQPVFNGKNGLPSSSINQITKDNEGRIWIATDNGLAIKNANDPLLTHLSSEITGAVKQIAFTKKLLYIGLSEAVLIYDANTYRLVKSIEGKEIGTIRRIRNINDTIWVTTNRSIFRITDINVEKIKFNEPGKIPFDVACFKNKIYLITYPRSSILEFNGIFFEERGLSKKVNPNQQENYLSMLVRGDTLILGGDHICTFLIAKNGLQVKKITLEHNFSSNPAIWDMAAVGSRVYYALGNTHQVNQGAVISSIYSKLTLQVEKPYAQCLFYDNMNDCLYIGTLHQGVFMQHDASKTYTTGPYSVASSNSPSRFFLYNNNCTYEISNLEEANQLDTPTKKIYPQSSLRKIKTIGDTTFFLSIAKIEYRIQDKYAVLWDKKKNFDQGRFFNDCFKLDSTLYFFNFYARAGIVSPTIKYTDIGKRNFIPVVEPYTKGLVCYNEGSGFKLYNKWGEHEITNLGSSLHNIDDFTCAGDTVYILTNNSIKTYQIKGDKFQLLNTFPINRSIEGFTANWIVHSKTGGLYLVSNEGILQWKNDNPATYHAIGQRKINQRPLIDPFNRLFIQAGECLTILTEDQLSRHAAYADFSFEIPETLTEFTAGPIQSNATNFFAENYHLKKLVVNKSGKLIYQIFFTGSTTSIPPLFKSGTYEVMVWVDDRIVAQQQLTITIPLNRNPLFFTTVGLLIIVFLFLLFRLKYNQKLYAKRLLDNKLEMLHQNLNPHFIFNSLNLIYSNILDEKKEIALHVLIQFSKLQRNFMERSKEKRVTLASELSFIQSYLDIEFLRYNQALATCYRLNVALGVETEHLYHPPNILQPLIENALKYGIIGYEGIEEKVIIIDISIQENHILLSIENPINTIAEKKSNKIGSGMGLLLVKERIMLYNNEMGTSIHLKSDLAAIHFKKGYRVELYLDNVDPKTFSKKLN